jgi:glycosyltransferase involved in cell wall biosynthesis/2-polyprenyl-3-methyl-5-hydroxy-6-metoxy-1,4-benzoquinol methylase
MKSLLRDSGYVFEPHKKIWLRTDYASIHYSDGDETELRIAGIIDHTSDLTVLSTELRQHCTDWPSLYHLSGSRANILRPFASWLSGDVLEIGAGCGAITRYLGESGANVLALEGSMRRAAIARARTGDLDNVTVLAERFEDFKCNQQFDVITLIGVLEYANLFTSGENPPLAMLERVRSLLKPSGRLIIAIENQLGLKYFAGALEDHLGQAMYGIEGRYRQDQPQTFGRKVLADMLGQAGFATSEFLAPFPDYKRPVSIITEEGFAASDFDSAAFAWQSVRRDWQLPEYCTFSLELAWPELVNNGLALDVANSFLIVASSDACQVNRNVLAYHYSTERAPKYCKETRFVKTDFGSIEVVYQRLARNRDEERDDRNGIIGFYCPTSVHYSRGKTLAWEFVQIVTRDGWVMDEVGRFIKRYVSLLEILARQTGQGISLTHPGVSLPGRFFDYVPQNIIILADGSPELIDTEWFLDGDIELGQLLLRAMWTLQAPVTRFGWNVTGRRFSRVELVKNGLWAAGFMLTERNLVRFFDFESLVQEQVAGGSTRKYFADWSTLLLPVHNLSQILTERDGQIAHLSQVVAERDSQIAQLDQAVRERDGQISSWFHFRNEVLSSTSWRLTRPLRVFVRQMKRCRAVADPVLSVTRCAGGLKAMLNKVFSFCHLEGLLAMRPDISDISTSEQVNGPKADNFLFLEKIGCRAVNLLAPRILIIAELSIPQCTKYRVEQKQEMIKKLGLDCSVLSWTDTDACLNALSTHSLVIFYRVPAFDNVVRIIAEAKRLKVQTLWEVDDLIFDREVLAGSRNLAELDQKTVQEVLEGARLYRTAMLGCDQGIASTTGLALAMQNAGVPSVFVVENALDRQTFLHAEIIRAARKKPKDAVIRIVYGSGTDTHNVDFREAAIALLSLLATFPEVRLRLIGTLDLPEEFTQYQSQIERMPFCTFAEYLHCLAECDVSIAPLEDYIFNDAKSNIKFLEAAVLRIPSVCSPRAAFRQAITHGVNGFLCATDDEWTAILTLLVKNSELREKIGLAAYDSVAATYSSTNIGEQQLLPVLKDHKRSAHTMRILTVNIFYRPRSFGGATIVAEGLNKILNEQEDFEIFVFTTLTLDVVPAYELRRYEVDGVSVFGVGLPDSDDAKMQFENFHILDAFENVLLAVKPDLVHFHSIQGIGVAVADLCVARGIRYVVTLHDAWWLCGRQFMVTPQGKYCNQQEIDIRLCACCVENADLNNYRQARLRSVLNKAALLLSPSQFFSDFYMKNGFLASSILVNKNGILKPVDGRKCRREGPLVFGYVGGNTEIKGVHLVKKVFADLVDSAIKLVVVDNVFNLGFSSYDENFFTGCGDVEIVPAYTQKTIDSFFSCIDVLLFPTQWKESFGLTIREALARNVWVITTDAGGVVEDIAPGKNGFVVPFDDNGVALKQAVLDAVQYYQRFNVGDEICLETTQISWFEDQAHELAGIYRRLIIKR